MVISEKIAGGSLFSPPIHPSMIGRQLAVGMSNIFNYTRQNGSSRISSGFGEWRRDFREREYFEENKGEIEENGK
jgi:hypothetical protein